MILKKVLKFIFSVENKYCYATKYKILKILGISIPVYKKTNFNGNQVFIIKNGIKKICKKPIPGLYIDFYNSKNNVVTIGSESGFYGTCINFVGTDSSVYIAPTKYKISNLSIHLCKKNQLIKIGENFSVNSANFACTDNDISVLIGDDCMFSWDINLQAGDSHPVYDKKTGERINTAKFIEIGNHVWLCRNTTVLKNVKIHDNSIVAANSTVTKSFKEPNSVIAGNPAKIVKKDIEWARKN